MNQLFSYESVADEKKRSKSNSEDLVSNKSIWMKFQPQNVSKANFCNVNPSNDRVNKALSTCLVPNFG